jgi:hypothetical protein
MAEAGAAPGQQAIESPRKGKEIFIDMNLNTFGAIVDAHNGLAHKFFQSEKQIGTICESQTKAAKNLKELSERQEEIQASQAKALEEAQRQNRALADQLKALLADQLKALEVRQDKALRTHDEELKPSIKAMERTVEDLAAGQSEVTTRTLPRWRADVGSDVQKIGTDLAEIKQQTTKRAQEQEARVTQLEAELQQLRTSLEQRITTEIGKLAARVDTVVDNCGNLSPKLIETENRLKDEQRTLSEMIQAQGERLEEHAKAQVQRGLDAIRDREGSRLDKLEKVFKAADFERLHFSETIKQDVDNLRAELPELRSEWMKEIEGMEKSLASHFANMGTARETLEQRVASEIETALAKIRDLESDSKALRSDLTSTGNQYNASYTSLREQLEAQGRSLEERIKEDNGTVRSEVGTEMRNEFVVRLAPLDKRLRESDQEHKECAQRAKEELDQFRLQATAGLETLRRSSEDVSKDMTMRLEPLHRTLSSLQNMCQEFGRLQEWRGAQMDELDNVVRAVESRMWPWRSANPRMRVAMAAQPPVAQSRAASENPSRDFDTSTNLSPQSTDWTPPATEPAQPMSARPASARKARPASATYRKAPVAVLNPNASTAGSDAAAGVAASNTTTVAPLPVNTSALKQAMQGSSGGAAATPSGAALSAARVNRQQGLQET